MPARPADAVETVYPLRWQGGRPVPFPTIYWLIDPELDRQVADLERRGAVAVVAGAIRGSAALMRRYRDDHQRYVEQRWAMLSPEDRAVVEATPAFRNVFRERGIAGIADWQTVKCLHAHVAHHLADRNTAAEVLAERYGLRLPPR